ncbi:uncharacterized protein PAC_01907 [Phialocephala subalpina]|uniref:2EXR domain-containing protein n=1 Tax=Phialocephala subalpina TaxID=576137 RepID=A0A1L7WGX2_9HELO|nr:uncharacterized protein PAC_01907 [Phialocephala subalpina]
MDSASVTVAVVRNELSDPGIILYLQPLPEFNTFTCFSDLPIELRLAIWQFTFKPRRTKIWRVRNVRKGSRGLWFTFDPAPLTLSIFQESRACALENYRILTYEPEFEQSFRYLNPEIDTLIFPNHTLLEVGEGFPWHFKSDDATSTYLLPKYLDTGDYLGMERTFSKGMEAGRLTKVKKLYLGRNYTEQQYKEIEKALRGVYEKMATKISGLDAPEIIFMRKTLKYPSWRDRIVRTQVW